ncbi:MAG TPA: SLC13 family permease [Streptosporangiaceae bacterium]|nr:SLC13 family permease [Streptosporangiaceae bacterium]
MRVGRRALRLRPDWLLAAAGLAGLTAAVLLRPADAAAAAAQDWSPFVLVAGLLLIGLVADDDGLFAAAGARLAAATSSGRLLFAGAVLLISIVTATLNLDTSVAFLTPVLVHTARSRGEGEPALLYGCLLLSNAASLLLPGSNLTNLIVLGHLHLTGGQFAARMWLPWLGAVIVTAAVVAIAERRTLRVVATGRGEVSRPVLGIGLAAIVAATVLVIVIRSAALPVFVIGAVAAAIRLRRGGEVTLGRIWQVLGVPVLAGLFGAAVALGTLGRAWSGPAELLSHLSGWATAAFAAVATALVNNLPAASMLAARTPGHPLQLLIGLNLGPNLCVTGSLAWLLWLQSARDAGARPSLTRASRLGVLAVPLSIAVAVAALGVTGAL